MDFYQEWTQRMSDPGYMMSYLAKTDRTTCLFRSGNEEEIKRACDFLKSIPMTSFIDALQDINFDRLPSSDEIPQCGLLEKAICEVPQILVFNPEGLTCRELGLKLGAEKHGDAPRKSGEGNGKFAASLDLAIRLKLPVDDGLKVKYGYKISSLGRYLLRYSELEDKVDILSRLMIREYVIQILIAKSIKGYSSYNEVTSSLKSQKTRLRRRQNVRGIITIIDSQLANNGAIFDNIDWNV